MDFDTILVNINLIYVQNLANRKMFITHLYIGPLHHIVLCDTVDNIQTNLTTCKGDQGET